ncbi:MAG: NTP transferase domain-containing protein [Pseudohongiellaceae bacterium]
MSGTKGAIILAAGFSKRYGSSKLLAKLDSGVGVFEQTYTRLKPAVDSVLVVTKPEIETAIAKIARNPLVFDEYRQGMGATLAFAASQLPQDWCSVLVCLGDMPFISTESYKKISETNAEDNIVIPNYLGKNANPVAFGRDFFPALTKLAGDTGAKALLETYQSSVIKLDIKDKALLEDIDTPNDLKRLQIGRSK